ncbi:MAG TPA: putative lipopolysaccharide heptosyltransferase III [Chthoniobacterales bacterium]|nr:putative lipopolysaccharide heptosyltransferase III [Chthoniobacterales bacterium]
MNILLIQLKRIGDLILTTPAIAALREKFPEATLSLVVSPAVEGLLPAISGIDKVFMVRGKPDDALDWIALAWGKFDYCLDFTRNDRSSFLTLLSQARKRITSDHPNLRTKIRARSYNELVESPVRHLHTVDYHLGLLKPLGIHDAPRAIHLDLPDSTVEKAEQLLHSERAGDEFVILHPGSARAEKFWEAERWARVIDHCVQERGLKCVLTGGRSPMERTQIDTIKSSTRAEVIDLSGKTDLLSLAALVRKARLLITVDSAPMHFAAAWGTPQVVLFGPTNPFHWHPRSEFAVILMGESDGPVSEFDPRQPAVPMNQISTQSVIDAMESLLSAPAAPARYE